MFAVLSSLFLVLNINIYGVLSTLCDEQYECSGTITDIAYCYGWLGCDGITIASVTDPALCYGNYGCYDAVSISANGVRCVGHAGCYNSGSISSPTSYINCDGDYGCSYAQSITAGTYISCASAYSCYQIIGSISAQTKINCNGYYSCSYIGGTITSDQVICSGDSSCRGSTIQSNLDTYCSGDDGCGSSIVNSGDDIWCYGASSCIGAELNAVGNVQCSGHYSCYGTTINAGDNVYVYGFRSAYLSTIYAENIYGYGYASLRYSILDSSDESAMNVFMYGYDAGFGTDFICRSGSTCNLYCYANGCEGMEFICYSGSICNLFCDDVGTICPTQSVTKSFTLSLEGDNNLDELIKQRQLERDIDSENISIKKEMEKIANDKKEEMELKQKEDAEYRP